MSDEKDPVGSRSTLDEKRDLLKRLLEKQARQGPPRELVPLSAGQQALWYLYSLDPASPAYNISLVLAIPRSANAEVARKALQIVTSRHEMLRATFESAAGVPMRRTHATVDVEFVDHSSSGAPGQIYEEAKALFERPFDLSTGPLVRAGFWRAGPDANLLILVIPHIISDAVSTSILEDEIQRVIAALVSGGRIPPALPERPYEDYVRWHEELLRGSTGERLRTYWESRFSNGIPRLELGSLDRSETSSHKEVVQFQVDRELSGQVEACARQEGTTPFVILMMAFGLLLGARANASVVPIGTAALGRNHPDFRRSVGYFANPILLTVDWHASDDVREVLDRVRSMVLDSLEHQEYPLAQLASLVSREDGGRSRSPVQAMFMHQGLQSLTGAAGVPLAARVSVSIDPVLARKVMPAVASRGGESELLLETAAIGPDLFGSFAYDGQLFDSGDIERLIAGFRAGLSAIVTNPSSRIDDVVERIRTAIQPPLATKSSGALPSPGRAGDTGTATYPRQAVHVLFLEKAELIPHAVAIQHGDRQVTYAELEERSAELARMLIRRGVKVGDVVGVAVERSAEAVAAMLAVLRCGAAYLPLDSDQPRSRIRSIIGEARVQTVIASELRKGALDDVDLRSILLVDEEEQGDGEVSALPHLDDVEAPAYVMYTSGSTGRPKGVVIPHRAIVRLVRNTNYVKLGQTNRIAQVSNLAFDAATFEIWGALLNGGTLIIVDRGTLLQPSTFVEALRVHRVTTVFLTTALFNVFAREMPDAFATLKHVLFGGEAVDVEAVRRVLHSKPPEELIHVYGPTENTTFTTWYRVTSVPADANTIPIGSPIAHTEVHVLDSKRRPLPPGKAGELFVGGDGLALLYLNEPVKTKERFVDHPSEKGRVVYRTGDRVVEDSEGQLVFLGRFDRQVKIRGHRVEPEEVERVLAKHPKISAGVVDVRSAPDRTKRLAAYFVPRADADVDPGDVRRYLTEHLPGYMVPTSVDRLSELPLTSNGKVDRSALPESSDASEAEVPIADIPRDLLELRLMEIWEELLEVTSVGRNDDFFERGGHSLLAVQMVSRVEAELGHSLPLSALLRAPTIAGLADILRGTGAAPSEPAAIPIRTRGSKPRLYCIPGAGGTSIMFHQLGRHLGNDQPLYGLDSRPFFEGRVGRTSIEEIASDAIELLLQSQPEGPYRLCGFSAGGLVAYEMAQQLRDQGREVGLVVLLDTFNPHALPFFRRRAIRQWQRLRSLSLAGQVAYVRTRLSHRLRSVVKRLRIGMDYRKRERQGMVPQGLMQERLMAVQSRAAYQYVPKPYPGRVALIRSVQRLETQQFSSDDFGWGSLISDLEVYHLPALHHEMVREPHVQHLARVLQSCLD